MAAPNWRSLLFVPATAEKFVARAHTRGAAGKLCRRAGCLRLHGLGGGGAPPRRPMGAGAALGEPEWESCAWDIL